MAAELPAQYMIPVDAFGESFYAKVAEGHDVLKRSKVVFAGLARNCDGPLNANLARLMKFLPLCREWAVHIEANDCTDNTLAVLKLFASEYPQATYRYQELGRESYASEFAGRRTIAMAEYRTACQQRVHELHPDADYVVLVDWDQWGGWSHEGLVNGFGWLEAMPNAYGMASVSLFEHDWGAGPQWGHYDLWALRGVGQRDCYWDQYCNGFGGFAFAWVPPVGSPPALVSSAFGGLCIYRSYAYRMGRYDGSDCEHVPFHQSIARATNRALYLNPSQRCVMHWMETPDAESVHGMHGVSAGA
jgi:hypothetical protein